MTVTDAIQRILLAWKDQDLFRRALAACAATVVLTTDACASCWHGGIRTYLGARPGACVHVPVSKL
jgi:hypothetical protein